MPAVPCANHPKETTFVRCGRCEKPICTRCMVDSPVGKKCRDCARNRTHIYESKPHQVLLAFAAATLVAIPAGFAMHLIPIIYIAPVLYGGLVGEVALRAGQRRRSLAMQVATGAAAVVGGLIGCGLPALLSARQEAMMDGAQMGQPLMIWAGALFYPAALVLVGAVIAVSRVRYL